MSAQIELKNVKSEIRLDTLNLDMKDGPIAIKDVHIGKGGEARTVVLGYDEVKQKLYLEIYELGGTEVLKKLFLADGHVFEIREDPANPATGKIVARSMCGF